MRISDWSSDVCSSDLLDVGFPDAWNARYVGLRVAKSLAYANATGFGHDCSDMARLAAVLTPYCRWNQVRLFGEPEPDDGGLTAPEVRSEEHPSTLQSLMRISYTVFCSKHTTQHTSPRQ